MKKHLPIIIRLALYLICGLVFIYALAHYFLVPSDRGLYLLISILVFLLYYEAAFFFECLADGKRVIRTRESTLKTLCMYFAFFALGYMFVSFSVSPDTSEVLGFLSRAVAGLCLFLGQEITVDFVGYTYETKQKA